MQWKEVKHHKNVRYSRFPRISSLIHKGFLVVDINGFFRNNIYLNGYWVGRENEETGALMLNWDRLYNLGYMDLDLK